MIAGLVVITAIAGVFYFLVPGIGAFHVRRRWRRFRRQIVETSGRRTLRYGNFERAEEGYVGHFRFIGALEAIQGSDTVWVHDGTMSVSADLRGVSVMLLPSISQEDPLDPLERNEDVLPDEMPV